MMDRAFNLRLNLVFLACSRKRGTSKKISFGLVSLLLRRFCFLFLAPRHFHLLSCHCDESCASHGANESDHTSIVVDWCLSQEKPAKTCNLTVQHCQPAKSWNPCTCWRFICISSANILCTVVNRRYGRQWYHVWQHCWEHQKRRNLYTIGISS